MSNKVTKKDRKELDTLYTKETGLSPTVYSESSFHYTADCVEWLQNSIIAIIKNEKYTK